MKICIVGGGTSGWMTAAAFGKKFPHYKVCLIESKDKPPLRVGESTLAHFNSYLDCIGVKDREWMPSCNATYKISIQFTNWKNQGDVFQYPFGREDYTYGDAYEWYCNRQMMPDIFGDSTFSEFYNPITYLANANKIVDNNEYIRNFDKKWDTAYHFDAQKFGGWLRDNICKTVENIIDEISGCEYKEDGTIKHLWGNDGNKYEAEYYIDCTGFSSLLLGHFRGNEFIEFPELTNDSALSAHISYKDKWKEMINSTDGYALPEGWVWTIPLWDRISKGYVYSSKFTDKDRAEKIFRDYLGDTCTPFAGDVNHIKFRHGRWNYGWIKNVIGVGLSYAFLEPLESTGLVSTHETIMKLINIFDRRSGHITQIDVDGFNYTMGDAINTFKDFIALHYYLSPRTDSEYWKYYTQRSHLSENSTLYNNFICCYNRGDDLTNRRLGGLPYIAAGLGYHPSLPTNISMVECQKSKVHYEEDKKKILKYLETQPSHYDYLRQHIYSNLNYA